MPSTVGVDVGTTGCKVAVLSETGAVLAKAHASYPLETPEPGAAELDPGRVWEAVTSSIVAACGSPRVLQPPSAIGITAAGEALIALDARGTPLHNVVTSIDTRTASAFRDSVREYGSQRLYEHSGLAPLPHYTVFRWRWFAETHPSLYAETRTLAGYTEWIAAQLGARRATDRSLAARSLAYRVGDESWDAELLGSMGLDIERLPEVVPGGSVIGAVGVERARELGLRENAAVVAAGLDQASAACALALPGAEAAMLSIGTTAVIGVEIAELTPDGPSRWGAADGIPIIPHVRVDYRLALAGTPAGGALLRWFNTRVLAHDDEPCELLDGIENHRTEVLALPHLGGSRVAFSDPDSRGAILGLRFGTTQRDVTRALLDGVAYELAVMLERLRAGGFPEINHLRAVGGGSLSHAWLQTIADVVAVPIETTGTTYAAAIGAASIARQAISDGSVELDVPLLPTLETVRSREAWSEHHAIRLDAFKRVYSSLAAERRSNVVQAF